MIADGTLTVDAAADGIQGKDSVKIRAGALTVTAGDDGIKSNNTEDAAAASQRSTAAPSPLPLDRTASRRKPCCASLTGTSH